MPEQHSEPIAEGLTHTGQRLTQFIALAVIGGQAYQRRLQRVQHAQRTQHLEAHRRAELARRAFFEQARSRWAPVHDPKWLQQADLLQVARAWSAAIPYSTAHRAAAIAVDKCEERLRRLHPHGMGHYDRFRNQGLSRLEAMREAIPFFARDPNVRTGEPAGDRHPLPEGTGTRWVDSGHSPGLHEQRARRQEQQALKLINELQTQSSQDLSPEDLRLALEVATNLPHHIIAQAVREATRATDPSASEISGDSKTTPHQEKNRVPASRRHPTQGPHPAPDRRRRLPLQHP